MSERINQHNNPIIGKNIKRLRKKCGLKSLEVIAKLQLKQINISSGTFSKIENGRNNPTTEMLIALTEIFKCDFNAFFDTNEDT